jgi:HAD superfamily hydrolase (TIGR01450 family)
LKDLLQKIRYFIFDVDGTLLLSNKVLPFASEIVTELQQNNIDFTILSNNSSFSIIENKERLERVLGVKLDDSNIYTSIQATIDYLIKNKYDQCYLVGTPGMIKDFEDAGIINTDINPKAVVLGFDKTLTYDKISKTALFLQDESTIPFFATHPDDTCPVDGGEIPDVGSFLMMFKQATERTADIILGKPNALILELCLSKSQVDFSEVLVIGDRLETDIQMANSVGIKSVLVLTGDTKREHLEKNEVSPTLIWDDLQPLYEFLKK